MTSSHDRWEGDLLSDNVLVDADDGDDDGGFCPDSLFPRLTPLRHVVPRGDVSAGRFTKVAHAGSLLDCTKACCAAGADCHLVFLHGDSCFLVHCRSAALCQPQRRAGAKFDSSFMVVVRPLRKSGNATVRRSAWRGGSRFGSLLILHGGERLDAWLFGSLFRSWRIACAAPVLDFVCSPFHVCTDGPAPKVESFVFVFRFGLASLFLSFFHWLLMCFHLRFKYILYRVSRDMKVVADIFFVGDIGRTKLDSNANWSCNA